MNGPLSEEYKKNTFFIRTKKNAVKASIHEFNQIRLSDDILR